MDAVDSPTRRRTRAMKRAAELGEKLEMQKRRNQNLSKDLAVAKGSENRQFEKKRSSPSKDEDDAVFGDWTYEDDDTEEEAKMEVKCSPTGFQDECPIPNDINREDESSYQEEPLEAVELTDETSTTFNGEANRSDQRQEEDGVLNVTNEETRNPLIRAIFDGKSKNEIESLAEMVEDWRKLNERGDAVLHVAARTGDLVAVKYLVSLGADVNARNKLGSTPLMEAAKATENFAKVADVLIKHGATLDATDAAGETAFYIAIQAKKNLEELEVLSFGTCLTTTNLYQGNTILHEAAKTGNLVTLTYFMSNLKPDVNVRNDDGWTPLMMATFFAKQNCVQIVDLLLRNGADPNYLDKHGLGVVYYAIKSKRPVEVVQKLVDGGALWMKQTILFCCIEHEHFEALNYFVGKGAEVNAVECWGWTPLTKTAQMGMIEAMVILLDHGAKPLEGHNHFYHDQFFSNATTEVLEKLSQVGVIWDGTVLHEFTRRGNLEGVRWCVKEGMKVDSKDCRGETPLFLAATADEPKPEVLDFLKAQGANINEPNDEGFTALHVATERGKNLGILKKLISLGATWDTGVGGDRKPRTSILHAAVRGGFPEVVEYFVSRGVNVNCRDLTGMTPFLEAVGRLQVDRNAPEILRALVNGGADPNAKDCIGNSAMLIAVHAGARDPKAPLTLDSMKLLVNLGCDWKDPNLAGVTVINKLEIDGNSEILEYFKTIN